MCLKVCIGCGCRVWLWGWVGLCFDVVWLFSVVGYWYVVIGCLVVVVGFCWLVWYRLLRFRYFGRCYVLLCLLLGWCGVFWLLVLVVLVVLGLV